jgi:hypothetical protein
LRRQELTFSRGGGRLGRRAAMQCNAIDKDMLTPPVGGVE